MIKPKQKCSHTQYNYQKVNDKIHFSILTNQFEMLILNRYFPLSTKSIRLYKLRKKSTQKQNYEVFAITYIYNSINAFFAKSAFKKNLPKKPLLLLFIYNRTW